MFKTLKSSNTAIENITRGSVAALTAAVVSLTEIPAAEAQGVKVVRNDWGGSVRARLAEVQRMQASRQRIEVRGNCMSACTLYLGAPNVCVSPNSTLGFHGPSTRFRGIPLPRQDFERWSRAMARHYPAPLRRWFMQTARHEIVDFHRISGRQAIRMGVAQC